MTKSTISTMIDGDLKIEDFFIKPNILFEDLLKKYLEKPSWIFALVKEGKPIAYVTERDLFTLIDKSEIEEIKSKEVITLVPPANNYISLSPNDTINTCLQIMRKNNTSFVPIIDESGQILAIIRDADVIRILAKKMKRPS